MYTKEMSPLFCVSAAKKQGRYNQILFFLCISDGQRRYFLIFSNADTLNSESSGSNEFFIISRTGVNNRQQEVANEY
jgi:hypothetical protein